MYRKICEKYGKDYMLRQLAEECCELSQAALKLIRAQKGETEVDANEALEGLIEEIADVLNCMDAVDECLLSSVASCEIEYVMEHKRRRWAAP